MTAYGATKPNGIWALEERFTSHSVRLLLCDRTKGKVISVVTLTHDEFEQNDAYVIQRNFPSKVLGDWGIDPHDLEKQIAEIQLEYRNPCHKDATDYFDHNGRFVVKRLADELLQTFQFKTVTDTKEIYHYNDGIWSPKAESLIHSECQKRLGEKASTHNVDEVINYIRGETYVDRRVFNADPNLVNLENGTYNIQNGELLLHSPSHMFTHRLPLVYHAGANCPRIEKFLEEIQPDLNDRKAMLELIGYCLYRAYPIQNAFMLVGDGANGKSTFIRLLKKFLGASNTASISLHDLQGQRFATAQLNDKHANLYPDLESKALYQTGIFKALTGEDQLTADKKFRDHFNFVNHAKMIFSANRVPESSLDDSDAFYRRWIVINFPNKFQGSTADRTIIDKLTTPEEMSGLLNLALKALRELLASGQFINDTSTDAKREQYIRLSDPVRSFVMDCVDASPQDWVKKDEAYQAFCQYCRLKKYPDLSKVTFDKRFRGAAEVQDYRPEIGGVRVYAWKGIKLRSDEDRVESGQVKLL
jgi:putative DNA primase/helicase